MPPEQRQTERPSYFTIKTPGRLPAISPRGLSGLGDPSGSPSVLPKPKASPALSPSAGQRSKPYQATSNPDYFSLGTESNVDHKEPAFVTRENFRLTTAPVKPFSAAIPNQLPVEVNPEFETFRRQIEANCTRSTFTLSGTPFTLTSSASAPSLQKLALPRNRLQNRFHRPGVAENVQVLPQSSSDDFSSLSSKENSVSFGNQQEEVDGAGEQLRIRTPNLFSNEPSPVSSEPSPYACNLTRSQSVNFPLSKLSGPLSGLSLGGRSRVGSRASSASLHQPSLVEEAETTGGPTMISPVELRDLLEKDHDGTHVLLLDLRVSPQFARSRVRGALNLCIPTTLLKRATFDLQKLQQTFQVDRDREKFSRWRSTTHLVVYDASSFNKRDAISSVNMIKKFTNEGYTGSTNILRGGFNAFAAAYPGFVDHSEGGPPPSLSLGPIPNSSGASRPGVPPVIGGCLIPKGGNISNPFFDNIRQNQDLIDGVGQIQINLPPGLAQNSLPRWLREASEPGDAGKKVSEKFLRIEIAEQARMRDAYSFGQSRDVNVAPAGPKVQLSGIEKGTKNRYRDILPFEHARVKLQGRPEGACDYVNASHIRAKRSNKRYIATQGPLPATFEDFWSVVWDQDVRTIVMLTAETEGGQLKCDAYWKGNDFGPIQLRVLSEKKVSLEIDRHRSPRASPLGSHGSSPDISENARRRANTTTTLRSGIQTDKPFNFALPSAGPPSETPYVIIRKFALTHTSNPSAQVREVTQLHYPSWPDFGAPAQPSHLLALVELANTIEQGALPVDVPATLSASVSLAQQFGLRRPSGSAPPASDKAGSGSWTRSANWNVHGPENNANPRPMLVHCSAGCGRTGTFCTVDSVIDMLKRQRQHVMAKKYETGFS